MAGSGGHRGPAGGQRLLVHAAAGGVGHLTTQIAKARGAYVIGTARTDNHELLRSLGVDEPVDYTARPFEEVVSDVDVVVDTIGGDYCPRSLDTLRPGGILVSLASPYDPPIDVAEAAAARGLRTASPLAEPDRLALTAITGLVAAGRLHPHIAEVFRWPTPAARTSSARPAGRAARSCSRSPDTKPSRDRRDLAPNPRASRARVASRRVADVAQQA